MAQLHRTSASGSKRDETLKNKIKRTTKTRNERRYHLQGVIINRRTAHSERWKVQALDYLSTHTHTHALIASSRTRCSALHRACSARAVGGSASFRGRVITMMTAAPIFGQTGRSPGSRSETRTRSMRPGEKRKHIRNKNVTHSWWKWINYIVAVFLVACSHWKKKYITGTPEKSVKKVKKNTLEIKKQNNASHER